MEHGSGVLLNIKRGGGGGEGKGEGGANEGKRVLLILEYDLIETTTIKEGVTHFTQKKLQILDLVNAAPRLLKEM